MAFFAAQKTDSLVKRTPSQWLAVLWQLASWLPSPCKPQTAVRAMERQTQILTSAHHKIYRGGANPDKFNSVVVSAPRSGSSTISIYGRPAVCIAPDGPCGSYPRSSLSTGRYSPAGLTLSTPSSRRALAMLRPKQRASWTQTWTQLSTSRQE